MMLSILTGHFISFSSILSKIVYTREKRTIESNWDTEVLIESFTITPLELSLVLNKTSENRLGFAILFKFFQTEGRFPCSEEEIHISLIKLYQNKSNST